MKTKSYSPQVVLSEVANDVLSILTQPVTATQLARQLRIPLDRCSNVLSGLCSQGLICCVNPEATRSRLFWLSESGRKYKNAQEAHPVGTTDMQSIDWRLYGTVCFSHRSEVIRTLSEPLQPAQIKRRAAFRKPGLRMSANNVRDVIRYLKSHGVVRPVHLKKRAHPLYELTELGHHFQRLLLKAEAVR
ncbi:hypothetical protein [Bythopirellula polymerisocia]|uniref:Helix-turn-helix domain protein n=1 Tax=Bythopirellula polymerisocia TaxID=2528003 RepID=A0A5C6CCU7_9BACT|nr:hypothetical protein [Bythopirellula polymerisocia]TWU21301.1 Helix-turn-helix domain protein [Bythopirellula polymerisocia]